MNYLPKKLLKLRKHYNYSQSYIADTLNVDVMTYMAYENGRAVINYSQAKRLAALYHIPINQMLENSEEVTLYNVTNANTDEINIEYFLPKKKFIDKVKEFMLNKPYIPIIGAFLILSIVLLLVFLPKDNAHEIDFKLVNENRLSVNETSLVFIDSRGAVRGSGDNSNSQLSNLPSEKTIKVEEGLNFTIILLEDKTVVARGLSLKNQEIIEKWKNIIDIASGDNHVLALDEDGRVYSLGVGDTKEGQLDTYDWRDIKKIFATPKGSIGIDDNNDVFFAGEVDTSSLIKNTKNIKDIKSSHTNTIILKEDGTTKYKAKEDSVDYYRVDEAWKDIIDIACGNDFFAGLKNDGTVLMASGYDDINKAVSEWKNIIAIDAYDDYLIGFDGENIYGVGNNKYHQFSKGEADIITLPSITKIVVDQSTDKVRIKFDPVSYCDKYKVTLNIGMGIINTVGYNGVLEYERNLFKEGDVYTISVICLGDGIKYEDSLPYEQSFTYIKQEKIENEFVITRNSFETMSHEEFNAYLKEIGITDIEEIVGDKVCELGSERIYDVKGIEPGTKYSVSDIKDLKVSYKYCMVEEESIQEGEESDAKENLEG